MTSNVNQVWEPSRVVHFCSYWLLPLLLTAGILIMAGDLGSVNELGIVIKFLEYLLPSYSKKEVYQLFFILRKAGHFLAYALLFGAYARAWRWHMKMTRLQAIFLALTICLFLAAGDESWQAFHPSRTGNLNDVILDMSGALTAAVALFPFLKEDDQGYNKKV
jgi:VanZ family protein